MHFFSVALLSILSGVLANPAGNGAPPSASICKSVSSGLQAYPSSASCATSFCSSFLSIKTKTVTVTAMAQTTTTLSSSTTAAQVVTITAPTVTATVSATTTQTSIVTAVAVTSSAVSTSTITSTVTSGTTTTTVTTCLTAANKRGLEERAPSCSLSAQLRGVSSSLISSGCACLSLTTPTTTVSVTSTSTSSTTLVSTITNSITTTPTTSITLTATQLSTTTTTTFSTINYVVTTTTTTTVLATATAATNICVAGPYDNKELWLGIQGPTGYGIASRADNGPQYTFGQFTESRQDYFYFHLTNGLLQADKLELGGNLNNYFLYVQDGVNGGKGYIGDLNTIISNGYYRLACRVTDSLGNNYYRLGCYSSNGVRFSPALQGDQNGVAYYFAGPVPSGYVSFDQVIAVLNS